MRSRPRPSRPAASWFGRLRQRAREQKGIAILEAAFITPVFFMLVLGVIELGLCLSDYLALSSAVRGGARVASASGNDVYADWGILNAVEKEGEGLDPDQIQLIVIYKPTTFGELPSATCQAGTGVAGVCNVYTYSDFSRPKTDFGCQTNLNLDRFWCPTTRKITLSGTGSDYVGVWVKAVHPWVTKMFGNVKTLTDSSVIRLEPRAK